MPAAPAYAGLQTRTRRYALVLRIIVGLALTAVAFAIAGRRLWWLYRLGRAGQPAPERIQAVGSNPATDAETQLSEVFGQRKLLKWSVPGTAHFLTFWGFIILILTIVEAYGDLFSRRFAIPGIGHWAAIGFLEDLFAVAVLVGIATFAVIRLRTDPKREGRESRFAGSHTGAAWLVLPPLNVLFSRRPNGLRALQPMRSGGKVLDFEEAAPDTDIFGRGKIEDFTWKGMLDMATCTECGRCQSQCPAWATGKPLSPKMVILDLRDH